MSAFWDASSLVHVFVPGQETSRAKQLLRAEAVVVWWGTLLEVRGVLQRLRREGSLPPSAFEAANNSAAALLSASKEVQPGEALRELAIEIMGRFPLKSADALQLAAALIWAKQKPRGRVFVANDRKLSAAAQAAGFDVHTV